MKRPMLPHFLSPPRAPTAPDMMPTSSPRLPHLFPSNSHTEDATQPPQSLAGAHTAAAIFLRFLVESASESHRFFAISSSLSTAHLLLPSPWFVPQHIDGTTDFQAVATGTPPFAIHRRRRQCPDPLTKRATSPSHSAPHRPPLLP
jgi:hypothetical protein